MKLKQLSAALKGALAITLVFFTSSATILGAEPTLSEDQAKKLVRSLVMHKVTLDDFAPDAKIRGVAAESGQSWEKPAKEASEWRDGDDSSTIYDGPDVIEKTANAPGLRFQVRVKYGDAGHECWGTCRLRPSPASDRWLIEHWEFHTKRK